MITGPILHECLKRSIGWSVKPVRPDKSHSWGCRDWHVWATEPPSTARVELRTNEGRQMSCEIAAATAQPRKSAWETAETRLQQPHHYAVPRAGVWHNYDDSGYVGQQHYDTYDTDKQYDGDWTQKCADAAKMTVEPTDFPDYWDPTSGPGMPASYFGEPVTPASYPAQAAAPTADSSWADEDATSPAGYTGWDNIRGYHNVEQSAPAPPAEPEQQLGETPEEFDLRRQAEAEAARRTAQHEAAAAQQARDKQAAAGDATSILLAKLQKEQADSHERTKVLHAEACIANGKIEQLAALVAGQVHAFQALEGTVKLTASGLTALETTVNTLNANVTQMGDDIRAFIAAGATKAEDKDKPAKRRLAGKDKEDDDSAAARVHSPSRQRSPRGAKNRSADDSARSDPGTGN